ncbi:GNAT family N-acetyltransferase [Intrasporangium sp. DVR]|uniref:GNAT family N-acetyltransferase n=1 Tax=Intrasporangium sp. DVR TaxID=3127867 RepID=UPI00313A6884
MPLSSLSFRSTSDPAEATTWFADLVAAEPVRMSVIASVTHGLAGDPGRYEDPRWWAGTDTSGRVVAAFMRTPPFPLHVAVATEPQAAALAERLAEQGFSVPGVGGRRRPVEAFCDAWVRLTGGAARTVMELGVFELPVSPRVPFAVSGHYRQAHEDEQDLVSRWAQDFADAVHDPTATPRPAPRLDSHVAAGRVGFWVDGGTPVSMAYASAANGGVTRVSGVWTPPALRGRGYASGLVAALSGERMEAGERCMLFTDLSNPTSNKIYAAIGYRRIGDDIEVELG